MPSNTVRGEVLLGKLVRIDGSDVDEDEPAAIACSSSTSTAASAASKSADDGDALPHGVEPLPASAARFSRSRRSRDRRPHARNPARQPDAVFPRPAGLLSALARAIRGAWKRTARRRGPSRRTSSPTAPFGCSERRIRDRIRLVKSDTYWDRDNVQLNVVDALSIDDRTTALNLYMTGKVDWITAAAAQVLRELLKTDPPRNDLNPSPQLTTYYYLLNTTRPPLDDVRVRRALVAGARSRGDHAAWRRPPAKSRPTAWCRPACPATRQQTCPPRNPEAGPQAAGRGRLPERPRLSQARNPLQHRPGAPGDRRARPQAMAAQTGHHRHAAERRMGLVPGPRSSRWSS